jgi:hypothetical protein
VHRRGSRRFRDRLHGVLLLLRNFDAQAVPGRVYARAVVEKEQVKLGNLEGDPPLKVDRKPLQPGQEPVQDRQV